MHELIPFVVRVVGRHFSQDDDFTLSTAELSLLTLIISFFRDK